ncbi:hypothetical protein GCM10020255_075230 [Rhodococcus baikonurensis]
MAGAELADEVGFEQVTVSAVARQFDVKVASLYSHVKSSNDLKTRIALLALEEMADQAADAVAGRSGRDALTAFANVYRNYAKAHPGRYAASQMRLTPEAAAASAGFRHAQMMRSILRGTTSRTSTRLTQFGCWAAFSMATPASSWVDRSATVHLTARKAGPGSSRHSIRC